MLFCCEYDVLLLHIFTFVCIQPFPVQSIHPPCRTSPSDSSVCCVFSMVALVLCSSCSFTSGNRWCPLMMMFSNLYWKSSTSNNTREMWRNVFAALQPRNNAALPPACLSSQPLSIPHIFHSAIHRTTIETNKMRFIDVTYYDLLLVGKYLNFPAGRLAYDGRDMNVKSSFLSTEAPPTNGYYFFVFPSKLVIPLILFIFITTIHSLQMKNWQYVFFLFIKFAIFPSKGLHEHWCWDIFSIFWSIFD